MERVRITQGVGHGDEHGAEACQESTTAETGGGAEATGGGADIRRGECGASDAIFWFGRDGEPVYIPGPNDTAPLIRRRIEQLQKYLGDDGFGFETAA
jgi:hypothetical protein